MSTLSIILIGLAIVLVSGVAMACIWAYALGTTIGIVSKAVEKKQGEG